MLHDGLRVFVDAVGRDVAQVSSHPAPEDGPAVSRLATSWARLVAFLDLGPAPELRACPHCGASGMRDATRCGYCWEKLVPAADVAA